MGLASLIDRLRVLQAAEILRTVPAGDLGRREPRPKKDKKIYFTDPFLEASARAWLATPDPFDASVRLLQDDAGASRVVETVVGQHLAMQGESPPMRMTDAFLWFHYDRRGEVDFVVARPDGGLTAIEVKWQRRASPSDLHRLAECDQHLLLTRNDTDLHGDVLMLPVPLFLALLEPSAAHL
jgi:hypothetical protein